MHCRQHNEGNEFALVLPLDFHIVIADTWHSLINSVKLMT